MKRLCTCSWAFGLGFLATTTLVTAADSEVYEWRNVQIVGGGFVPGIVFNQSEPNLIYARTDIGGAYRWNEGTQSWIPLTDWIGWHDWGLTGIVSLATDPVEPDRVYLAAGTYTNSWDPNNGAILRSSDRGATWQRTALPFKLGGNMPGRGMGERLAIDPNDNSILYLGAPSGNGLWRSVDFGVTWAKVTSFPTGGTYAEDPSDPNGYLNDIQGLVWITFDSRSGGSGSASQTIYVGVADLGLSVYRSQDGGATWSAVPGQPTGFVPHKGVLDDTNGFLYVAYSDNGGPYGGEAGDVWKLDTATGVWSNISPVPSSDTDNNFFGYSGLTIDRQNPNIVMVTAYSSWWPDTQIWRSLDSGATWSPIWQWTRYPNRSFRYTQDVSAAPWLEWGGGGTGGGRPGAEVYPKLGWMTESLEIDPHNSHRMFYGTGATIYGSDNLTDWDQNATSQITITVKAVGLEETAIQELVSLPEGPPLLSGMYDIYGFTHVDIDTVPDLFFTNPTIATVSIDYAELSPNIVWRSGDGDAEIKSAGYSSDHGLSWTPVGKEPVGTTNGGTIAVSASGARVVWSPEGSTVHYTTNSGTSWTASGGIPAGAQVRSDRVNPNKFYGFSAGTLYASVDGGVTFAAAATGLPSEGQFKAVPGNEGHLWLATGGSGLWRSTDSGASFTLLANVDEGDNVGFGKAAPGQTYPAIYSSAQVDGVRGIYRSDDAGATWIRVNDDQHQYAWTGKTITGDPLEYGRVYVATNGRGIIVGDIPLSSTPPAAPSSLATGAVTANSVALSWTDNADDETGFEVQRALDSGFTSGVVTEIAGANATDYTFAGLASDTTYYFRVRSVNSIGASSYSNVVSAVTDTETSASFVHIDSIAVTTVSAGKGTKAGRATVVVVDENGAPVEKAVVSGDFTGGIAEQVSGTTGANGVVVLQTSAAAKGNFSLQFCVTSVQHGALTYDSASNVETCDSL